MTDHACLGPRLSALRPHQRRHLRLLTLLRVYDEEERWQGCRSCAHWLSWRTGISLGPAREKVRVARCLPSLPLISGALAKGEISYSKVRALTRIAWTRATTVRPRALSAGACHCGSPTTVATRYGAGSTPRWGACYSRCSKWPKPGYTAPSVTPGPRTGPQRRSAGPTPWGCGWKSASSPRCSLWCTRSKATKRRPLWSLHLWSLKRARAFQLKRPRGSPAMQRWCTSRERATVRCSTSGAARGAWGGGCARPSKHATEVAASPDAGRACAPTLGVARGASRLGLGNGLPQERACSNH